MTQNRNKLLDLFAGNLANVIVHKILEKATESPEISEKYFKEVKNSLDVAKTYRDKINPTNSVLPDKDVEYIKKKVLNTVKIKLEKRISKGYPNININLVEQFSEEALKELKCK